MPQNDGFTLAETLITLVIIGVIAAITVPTLITKYQKEQTVTRLKKVYSTLAQTTARAIADNGPIDIWELGEAKNNDDAIVFLNKYVVPYMNVMKKPTSHADGGWDDSASWLNNEECDKFKDAVRFYLNDGTSVTSWILNNDANYKQVSFFIDINGDKKPNKFGRDIFQLNYFIKTPQISGVFIPSGYGNDRETLKGETNKGSCNKLKTGQFCAALIMVDSWQIKDDYPW